MEIQNSFPKPAPKAQPVRLKTADELLIEAARRDAEAARQRAFGDCPIELATFAAGACALVYHSTIATNLSLMGAEAEAFVCFDKGGTQAVAFARGDHDWIVFRGSESAPERELFLDWGYDLLAIPWGWPPRHLGFALGYRQVRRLLRKWINTRPPERRLVLAGHSLGGALAMVAAADIAGAKLRPIEAVITFGAPKPGTWWWRANYRSLAADNTAAPEPRRCLAEVTWRIESPGDIVTFVPPWPLFLHCGKSISPFALPAEFPLVTRGGLPFEKPKLPAAKDALAIVRSAAKRVKQFVPATPLLLLGDILLAIFETAPQHFMRHYGPVFPERPFRELGEPKRTAKRTIADYLLCPVKWLIVAGILAPLLWLAWRAYHLSPDLTAVGLVLLAVFIFAGVIEALNAAPPKPPTFLARPKKEERQSS